MLTLSDGERVYLGDVVISDVELHQARRQWSMETRLMVNAKLQRVIDAPCRAAREVGALAFRRALSMGRE